MSLTTGAEYLQRLQDGRRVWLEGETVADVTAHEGLRASAREIAALYDLQHDPLHRDALTVEQHGERHGRAYMKPGSAGQLVARREGFEVWARASLGMLGRSPDYMATCLTAFAANQTFFSARENKGFAENLARYHEDARRRDLCLSHTFAGPRTDKSKTVSGQGAGLATALRIVGETDSGPVVRGMRSLATLAPLSDELLVFGAGRPLQAGEEDHSISFAIPVHTPGLQLICREPFTRQGRVDHPLASRFDEMDCVAVFEDLVVPWERVFVYRDIELDRNFKVATHFNEHVGQQVLARRVVKTELVLATVSAVVESTGLSKADEPRRRLGEIVTGLDLTRACLRAAEADAFPADSGMWTPATQPMLAGLRVSKDVYAAAIGTLRDLSASGLFMTPTSADLEGPLAEVISQYYRGATADGKERTRVYRLAWDLVGEAFGSRQLLFEKYFLGDPARSYAAAWDRYDKGRLGALLEDALAGGPTADEPTRGRS
ncbi:4-hydroxyphenylacetate 3-monooxygenase, oxygenase component [Streptomyces sp. NBC_00726]|uniref:4-hydroxyphenylacetate 3-hydroxylase family protein n=1 Tax=Streptomyces sp. NBC_00726 TaxID=2903674 RepID=UPI003870BEB4